MIPLRRLGNCLLLATMALILAGRADAQYHIPAETWSKFNNVEDAGFSSELLERARVYNDSLNTAAVLVVYRGAVVAAWGDVARRYRLHSVRKSLMSAMYGVYVEKGVIDTSKTLQQLRIDDSVQPLTDEEKQARIVDLLSARSGVFLPAAYEPETNPKPERGSFPPGTRWCYNNWDFNTLLTIFEQETGTKFFEDFDRQLARPLQMQDYNPSHGYYHYERHKSSHPAYPMRCSARDLARLGLLYLNHGKWGDRQILSENWVAKSSSRISDSTWTGGYGYLWWLYDREPFKSLGMYSARGLGEQSIDVIPGVDMVVVIRTDTYAGENVAEKDKLTLLGMILDAKNGEPNPGAVLVPMPPDPDPYTYEELTDDEAKGYAGQYLLVPGFSATVTNKGNKLYIEMGEGEVPIHKIGENKFIVEDFRETIYFDTDTTGSSELTTLRKLLSIGFGLLQQGQPDLALEEFNKAEKYYPGNEQVKQAAGDAHFYISTNEIDSALACYRQVTETNPQATLDRTQLAWWLIYYEGQVFPPEFTEAKLQNLAGKYGQRVVEFRDGQLYYALVGGDAPARLIPITETVFALEGKEYYRIRFSLDAQGKASKITGMYSDGRQIVAERDM